MKNIGFFLTLILITIIIQSCNTEEDINNNRYIANKAKAQNILKKYDLSENNKNISLDRRWLDKDFSEEDWIKYEEIASKFTERTQMVDNLNLFREKFQKFLFKNYTEENKASYQELYNKLTTVVNFCQMQKIIKNHLEKFPAKMVDDLFLMHCESNNSND